MVRRRYDDCKILETLREIKLIKKKNQSNSVQYLANMGGEKVFLKVFDPEHPIDNSLSIETEIYRNQVTKMLSNQETPHLVPFLFAFRCNRDVMKSMGFNQLPNSGIIEGFVTPQATRYRGAMKLMQFKNKLSDKSMKKIIFQTLYTIHVLNKRKLRHNDMHMENIFIEHRPTPVKLSYYIPGAGYHHMTTNFIVKIYDWDRGMMPSVVNGFGQPGFCKKYKICNNSDTKYDMFRFIGALADLLRRDNGSRRSEKFKSIVDVRDFLVSPEDFRDVWLHYGSPDTQNPAYRRAPTVEKLLIANYTFEKSLSPGYPLPYRAATTRKKATGKKATRKKATGKTKAATTRKKATRKTKAKAKAKAKK